jgi:hypothetical protein
MKAKTKARLTVFTVVVIGIVVAAIAIPNILVWQERKTNPNYMKAPDGAMIQYNGQNHLVIIDQNGSVIPYIQDAKGNFIKVK